MANHAEDAERGRRLIGDDESEEIAGANRSTWVVLAPTAEALGGGVSDELMQERRRLAPRIAVAG